MPVDGDGWPDNEGVCRVPRNILDDDPVVEHGIARVKTNLTDGFRHDLGKLGAMDGTKSVAARHHLDHLCLGEPHAVELLTEGDHRVLRLRDTTAAGLGGVLTAKPQGDDGATARPHRSIYTSGDQVCHARPASQVVGVELERGIVAGSRVFAVGELELQRGIKAVCAEEAVMGRHITDLGVSVP